MDKCAQCGKPLVDLKAGWSLHREQYGCPDHGENCVWRECDWAGKAYPQHESGPARACTLKHHLQQPSDCVSCPIPDLKRKSDLWDALRQRALDLIKEAEEHQTAAVEDAAKEYWENRAAELVGFLEMMKEVENADA